MATTTSTASARPPSSPRLSSGWAVGRSCTSLTAFEMATGCRPRRCGAWRGGGARVIVPVDCGITANAEVALATDLGIDVVVTDHHHVPTYLPAAHAVLN